MMRMLKLLAAVAFLAGCAAQAPSGAQIRASFTQAQLERLSSPLMLAEMPDSGMAATLVPASTSAGVEVWRTAEGQTLSFRDGILISTRGLGDDLMSADVAGTLHALNSGGGEDYSRLLTYLDGEDRTLFRAMICSMSAPTPATVEGIGQRFATLLSVETCHTTGLTVTNRYWRDGHGIMRRAEQWVGPAIGMLATERLTG